MRNWAVLALGLLAGCAAPNPAFAPLAPDSIPTLPYDPQVSAVLNGSLMYERGCLLFHDDGSGRLFLPVWPDGSSFNGAAVSLHLPSKADQPIVISEEVSLSVNAMNGPLPEQLARFEHQCPEQPLTVAAATPAD